MAEYINRDALLKELMLDPIGRMLMKRYNLDGFIKGQPTVEAVPVVRCKDCKYYRDGDCWHECDNDGQIYYQSVINEPNPDDYCSRAKRKEK